MYIYLFVCFDTINYIQFSNKHAATLKLYCRDSMEKFSIKLCTETSKISSGWMRAQG